MTLRFIFLIAALFMLVLCGVFSVTAHAQFEPQKEQAIDEALGLGPQYYIPQTGDILEDTALRYLHACMGWPHKMLSHNQQLELCRCTSENLKTDLTPAQMEVLFDDNDNAPLVEQSRFYLFTKAMARCLKRPVYDFVLRNCMTLETQPRRDTTQRFDFSTPRPPEALPREHRRNVCTCTADMTAQDVDINGATYVRIGLNVLPNTHDPSSEFMADEIFARLVSRYKGRCYQIYVLNWR
jgi:hypothetical protein